MTNNINRISRVISDTDGDIIEDEMNGVRMYERISPYIIEDVSDLYMLVFSRVSENILMEKIT